MKKLTTFDEAKLTLHTEIVMAIKAAKVYISDELIQEIVDTAIEFADEGY